MAMYARVRTDCTIHNVQYIMYQYTAYVYTQCQQIHIHSTEGMQARLKMSCSNLHAMIPIKFVTNARTLALP